jgi:hypothetical protein
MMEPIGKWLAVPKGWHIHVAMRAVVYGHMVDTTVVGVLFNGIQVQIPLAAEWHLGPERVVEQMEDVYKIKMKELRELNRSLSNER